MPPMPPITQALLLINVAFFCLAQLIGGLLLNAMALRPMGMGFMPWQLITYSFLHADMLHLFFNMMGLWMFGAELERLWGGKRFLHFYMASVLTAAFAQMLVAALMHSASPTIGASGGLFGLLMAYGMLFPNRIIMPLIPPIPMRARTFVAVYGAIELVMGYFNPTGGVAHFAHLGGMLGGFLMIRYWRGEPPFGGKR
jgi:membrane associated rhomboid family serine protease